MNRINSFDVFDTALVRKTAFPSDVFRITGERIEREMFPAGRKNFVEDFVTARLAAERIGLSKGEETTLSAIWENLRDLLPSLPISVGADWELDVERSVLAPNPLVANQIKMARNESRRVIFVSDTYLPKEFVFGELLRLGLALNGDGIYVSSEFGLTKRTGKLFDEVLRREGVVGGSVLHCGDNFHSDFDVPRKLGIVATLVPNMKLSRWEQAVLATGSAEKEFVSRLVGVMRVFGRNTAASDRQDIDDLVATFLGPLLIVWAVWLLNAARRDDVSRLYFIARDSSPLFRVARILAPQFGDVDCKYLKISRHSVLLPSEEKFDRKGLPRLLRPWEIATLKRLVQKLGLEWSKVASEFADLAKAEGSAKTLQTETDWDQFWNVVESDKIAALIADKAKFQRQNLLQYLDAEGLNEPVSSAVVDVGWTLTVQAGLQRLLNRQSGPNSLSGYYLGLTQDRIGASEAGETTALYYSNPPDHATAHSGHEIFRRVSILEHLLGLADHGTILEHRQIGSTTEAVGAPVSAEHKAFVDRVFLSVESFSRLFVFEGINHLDDRTARELIDTLIRSWCGAPSKIALGALSEIEVSDGPYNLESRQLLERWKLKEAVKLLIPERLHRFLGVKVERPFWPEAATTLATSMVSLVLRLRQARRAIAGRIPD